MRGSAHITTGVDLELDMLDPSMDWIGLDSGMTVTPFLN